MINAQQECLNRYEGIGGQMRLVMRLVMTNLMAKEVL
ncbi:hypothetical protein LYNGBM3L_73810 [Moorena producens 3L]|uniref:Uncharacterized protein n=1 Tax=Moorena producens 3L TaxID=489825 RepID=F4Y3T3_9CYAN|nr:hypothetical protein LYNGBM3L_73810 [Moorena producens 3L]